MKALFTRKLGMTSTINENGVLEAVTILQAGQNVITQLKNEEIDGYLAAQIGIEEQKRPSKPQAGHSKSLKHSPKLFREIRLDEPDEELSVGKSLNVEQFSVGDQVNVTATSKGKGWAGTIKRHNFHRGRKTHGGRSYRRPGSIGSMYPQHILKGKKMAGQMGSSQVTVQGLKVTLVDAERNLIGVKGAVPGPRKGIVIVRGKA